MKWWVAMCVCVLTDVGQAVAVTGGPVFEISFPSRVRETPLTGRVLVIVSRKDKPEVRLQADSPTSPPIFGKDVQELAPGQAIVIDNDSPGFPLHGTKDIPAGDYYVQALANVYTEFHRADGHTIWAHMDQWEGQRFNVSPGNLYSRVTKLHLDGSRTSHLKISLTETIPPIQIPRDTEFVKHLKIKSQLLSKFWGRPIYLGAVILLPKDYELHSQQRYPVIYQQDHFSLEAPLGFEATDPLPSDEVDRRWVEDMGTTIPRQLHLAWMSAHFPRMVAVTLLHPTPYYDDSYAVNSANTGPYGDAIMQELIPYIERQFRIISQSYARVLFGGSTGGWESLALQLYHPEFFGGAWIISPDPVDFRRYLTINLYRDTNAYVRDPSDLPTFFRSEWMAEERPLSRSNDGQPIISMREASQFESVLGIHHRSGSFLDNWEAVYGPIGDDGYPRDLWDRRTGMINHDVARYMKSHGYDLASYAATNWSRIGPQLIDKLYVYCGDMDNFYLNLSVYLFQSSLATLKSPNYAGTFEYGRPMKGHGWRPMSITDLVKIMAEHMAKHAPAGAPSDWMDE